MEFEESFVAERDEGIDSGGAAGGEVTGEKRDGCEEEWNSDESDQVVGLHAVKKRSGDFGGGEGGGDTEKHRDGDQGHALADDEAPHSDCRSAEREANADFARAAADGIAHDAVESDSGKKQTEKAEKSKENSGKARKKERVAKVVRHGLEIVDGKGRIKRMDLIPDQERKRGRVAGVADQN